MRCLFLLMAMCIAGCSTNDSYELVKLAEGGDAHSQYILAGKLSEGDTIPHDLVESAEWYRKSAEQGYPPAQYNLGYIFLNGIGIDADENMAAAWYRKASENGVSQAQFNLGLMYNQGRGVEKKL